MTGPLTRLAGLIRQQTGIEFSPGQQASLLAAIDRAAPGLSPEEVLRAAGEPGGGELMSRLTDEVTVQETTFARDRGQLDAIDWRGLRARARGTVRVWSAGCATGEEPYTLALLADEALAPQWPPVDTLGTDISPAALAAAQAGRYHPRAVRGLAPALLRRCFERQPDGTYLVGERLRRLVRLRQHNLARDPFPPPGEDAFDLVVCRNVLMYFAPALAGRVIGSLERALRPGGTLLLGATDALQRTSLQRTSLCPATGGQKGGPAGLGGPPAGASARKGTPDGIRGPGKGHPGGAAAARGDVRAQVLPPRTRAERLAAALTAAGQGDHQRAADQAETLVAENPLDADAHFIRGLIALDTGDPARAVAALRHALYADPTFALAAFTLGRAHDERGDAAAARCAYRQALGLLDPEDLRHEVLLQQVDIADIAAACRARLGGGP